MKNFILLNNIWDMSIKQYHPTYVIRIQGKLELELASWFQELAITEDTDDNTLLSGELPDQAALIGILLRAHNLNLQILSFNIQDTNPSEVDGLSAHEEKNASP
jgi:hypothetical protein